MQGPYVGMISCLTRRSLSQLMLQVRLETAYEIGGLRDFQKFGAVAAVVLVISNSIYKSIVRVHEEVPLDYETRSTFDNILRDKPRLKMESVNAEEQREEKRAENAEADRKAEEQRGEITAAFAEVDRRAENRTEEMRAENAEANRKVDKRMEEIRTKIEEVETKVEEVGTKVEEVGTKVEEVGTKVEEVGANVKDMLQRVKNLQGEVGGSPAVSVLSIDCSKPFACTSIRPLVVFYPLQLWLLSS